MCFGDTLHLFQWLGVALIIGGVFLVTVAGKVPGKDKRSVPKTVTPPRASRGGRQ